MLAVHCWDRAKSGKKTGSERDERGKEMEKVSGRIVMDHQGHRDSFQLSTSAFQI